MTTNSFQGPFLAVPLWAYEVIRDRGQPRDLHVLTSLVALMERRTKEVRASVQQIADYSVLSRETIKRSIKWLEDNNLITTIRRGKPIVNSYRINYTPPQWLTGEPLGEEELGGQWLMGEPLNGSRVSHWISENSQLDAGKSNFSIDNKDIDIEISKRAEGGKGEDMIIGGDPESVDQEFDKSPKKKKPQRNVNRLVTQFVSDPRWVMKHTYSYRDMVILRRTFNTLRDSGLTEFSISQMIRRFIDVDHWRTSENPVLLFTNKSVQKKLMEQIDTEVSVDDPVLGWMMADFERIDIDLPWPESNDSSIRREVIMNGMDACFRYPEVVADLITSHNGAASSEFRSTLSALNSLVRVLSEEEEGDTRELLGQLAALTLPDEINKLSKSQLRSPASSILEAVYNYRRISHGRQ